MTTVDMGVCRWRLECEEPATVLIKHSTLGTYPVCAADAAPHQEWEKGEARGWTRTDENGKTWMSLMPHPEPRPECFCPDSPRKRVPYCPECGTKEQRGVDPLAEGDDL